MYRQLSLKHGSNHTCKHSPSHTLHGLPQLVEWGHSLGQAQSFLQLAVNDIYSVSASRWDVHGGRSGQRVWDHWVDQIYWKGPVIISVVSCSYCVSLSTQNVLSSVAVIVCISLLQQPSVVDLKDTFMMGSHPCSLPTGIRWRQAGWRRGEVPKTAARLYDTMVPLWAWWSR